MKIQGNLTIDAPRTRIHIKQIKKNLTLKDTLLVSLILFLLGIALFFTVIEALRFPLPFGVGLAIGLTVLR